ncbi:hypothetical protein KKP3000_001499 [Alicyclobacillus fastidiosus]|uniref:Uncharacterized protein n=1 Tax=Alicyclobacillus fastidiosus TaxID=392011 RepID=A0ABV5AA23_9BACL
MGTEIDECIQRVIGQRVTFRRLAGNTLILYLNCNPDDNHGYSVWIEPTWHYANTTEVLVGSRQAQVDDKQELDEIAELMNGLDAAVIKSISIDSISHDIHISFEQGYSIKSFVADPMDDFIWYISDRASKLQLLASPRGVEIVDL